LVSPAISQSPALGVALALELAEAEGLELTEAEVLAEAEGLELSEAEGLVVGEELAEAEGLSEAEGLALSEAEGLVVGEELAEAEGLELAEAEVLAEAEGLELTEAEGLVEGDAEILALGEEVAIGVPAEPKIKETTSYIPEANTELLLICAPITYFSSPVSTSQSVTSIIISASTRPDPRSRILAEPSTSQAPEEVNAPASFNKRLASKVFDTSIYSLPSISIP
jgi:hypothetical protein